MIALFPPNSNRDLPNVVLPFVQQFSILVEPVAEIKGI
jgi:hypothetical protein